MTDLAKGMEEILPYANAVFDEDTVQMVDTNLVDEATKKLYTLVGETAGYILEYVKHGRTCAYSPFLIASLD